MVNECLGPTNLSFLLSRWYAEDCERLRLLQPLKSLRAHPIDILVSCAQCPLTGLYLIYSQVHTEGDLLDYRPYVMQEEGEWEASTQLPYDPFTSCAVLRNQQFDCPSCSHCVVVREFASSSGLVPTSLTLQSVLIRYRQDRIRPKGLLYKLHCLQLPHHS